MFGELSILDNLPNFATATTNVDSEIYIIPKNTFKEVFMEDPDISSRVMQSLVRKIRILSSQVEDLAFKSSYSRVASYLVKLVHVHGQYTENVYRFNIKFTHQEMADLTGLSRVTVSNIMSDLVSKEVLSKTKGYLTIKKINVLYELM